MRTIFSYLHHILYFLYHRCAFLTLPPFSRNLSHPVYLMADVSSAMQYQYVISLCF